MNIQQMMKQAQEMQSKLKKVQDEMAEKTVVGTAGGGEVEVIATCKGEIKSINIKNIKLLHPDEKEMLEDLIVAAINDARKKADEEFNDAVGAMGLPPEMLSGGGLF